MHQFLNVCALVAGGLFMPRLFYGSLMCGLDGAIPCMPLIYTSYPASIVLSCAAMAFAGAWIDCALARSPSAPAMEDHPRTGRGLALCAPRAGYQFAVDMGERFAGGIAQILERPGHQLTISCASSFDGAKVIDLFVERQGGRGPTPKVATGQPNPAGLPGS